MKHRGRTPLIIVIGFIVVAGFVGLSNTSVDGNDPFFEGNVQSFTIAPLSLVQDTRSMDCDAFNEISVSYVEGGRTTLASGKEGMAPFIDDSVPLDLAQGGKAVSNVHFEFWLECDGDAMDGTTTVSGNAKTRLCGDPSYSGTKCIFGEETPISMFDSFTFGPNSLQAGVKKLMYSHNYQASALEAFFPGGTGNIFFKHETFPILTFNFIHPTAGQFTGTYNAEQQNDKVVSQYGLISVVAGADGDGDGIPDDVDQCPTQQETVNGYLDEDGCPDTPPGEEDTDDDGIPDDIDQCPSQPETYNGLDDEDGCPDSLPSTTELRINFWSPQLLDKATGDDTIIVSLGIENFDSTGEIAPIITTTTLSGFVKETFTLPSECLTSGFGFNDCETAIGLDLDRYNPDSYKIKLDSPSRDAVIIPFEILDGTPDPIDDPENSFCQDNPNAPTCVETDNDIINVVTDFFTGDTETTQSGVKITRSNTNFSDFGQDDIMIIFILIAIVFSVALLARFAGKKK